MDKAKSAIAGFTSKHGHKTDVSENVAPAVTDEHVKPVRHEETTQAIDRETHQHHHHTTVQPLEDRQVLPEQHSHQMGQVEERTFNHGNEQESQQRLQQEAAQFRDTSRTHQTQQTSAQAPTVQGEHVHHHVHENVQPVVHKETIRPEVVHTTVPIHETHYADTQHHGTSVLPTKTLDDFSKGGGSLAGSKTGAHESYEGAPRQYNKDMMSNPTDADLNPLKKGLDGPDSHHTGGTNASRDNRSGRPVEYTDTQDRV